jgi:uncharacterized protein (DUF488 family)
VPRQAPLFTIGYDKRELDELVAMLGASVIDRVVDVRELPLSRRRGFSKKPLAAALEAVGIEYVHVRAAGNPFRKEPDALARYRAHLTRAAVAAVVAAARGHRAALLCFCRDSEICHRGILAPRVARALDAKLVDL